MRTPITLTHTHTLSHSYTHSYSHSILSPTLTLTHSDSQPLSLSQSLLLSLSLTLALTHTHIFTFSPPPPPPPPPPPMKLQTKLNKLSKPKKNKMQNLVHFSNPRRCRRATSSHRPASRCATLLSRLSHATMACRSLECVSSLVQGSMLLSGWDVVHTRFVHSGHMTSRPKVDS